jgi:hypothetical protein
VSSAQYTKTQDIEGEAVHIGEDDLFVESEQMGRDQCLEENSYASEQPSYL